MADLPEFHDSPRFHTQRSEAPARLPAAKKNTRLIQSEMGPRYRKQRQKEEPQVHMKLVDSENVSIDTKHKTTVGGIRGIVSKKKRRYIEGPYDLDLTYITSRLIAMGFPSEGMESIYRNSMEMTTQFFEDKHPGHYWIYNLCSERSYDEEKFKNRVIRFGFDDHNCPIFESMQQLCEHLDEWLSRHPENRAALHCKAGKGRTGLMICVYLIHTGFYSDPEEAMGFYGYTRTENMKGVTIPSQRRWVHYYSEMMKRKINGTLVSHQSKPLRMKRIVVSSTAPGFSNVYIYNDQSMYSRYKGTEYLETRTIMVAPDTKTQVSSLEDDGWEKVALREGGFIVEIPDVEVYKDVKVQFEKKTWGGMSKTRVFSFWFHTDFINPDPEQPLILTKSELDKANKEKGLPDFYIEVYFEPVDSNQPKLRHHLTRKLFPAFSDEHLMEPEFLDICDASQKEAIFTKTRQHIKHNDELTEQIFASYQELFGLNSELVEELWIYVKNEAPQIPCNVNINDEELIVLAVLMQGNLDIRNRVWKNRAYHKTWVGAEAVAWLTELGFESTEDIIAVGSRMLEHRFFDHVPMVDENESIESDDVTFTFQNSHQFYRFNTSFHTLES